MLPTSLKHNLIYLCVRIGICVLYTDVKSFFRLTSDRTNLYMCVCVCLSVCVCFKCLLLLAACFLSQEIKNKHREE